MATELVQVKAAPAAGSPPLAELISLSHGYPALLKATQTLRAQAAQPVPDVSVSLNNAGVSMDVPVVDTGFDTVGSKTLDLVLCRKRTRKMQSFALAVRHLRGRHVDAHPRAEKQFAAAQSSGARCWGRQVHVDHRLFDQHVKCTTNNEQLTDGH